ncbi:MAG TPA: LysM peptidoglycan-binding domain-containing protein [Roseiflexaceae bacterium]|jgi:LysM repeat protein|nr:LysM peptidoglycan-binding domain-containing protein [Roseiflexaceae bacterium]
MVELKRAKIEVLDPDARKPAGQLDHFFDVQFNPTEYTRTKAAQIAEIGIYGIDSPILQFIRGQNEKLALDLFFDTTTLGGLGENAVSVTTVTEPFYQLCKIQPKTHALPRIRFTWSEALSFKAIVESVQQKFTLFNPKGLPLRATLSVSFREYKTLEEQLAELKLESVDHTKCYVVQRGDTLSRIAAKEYGDPGMWRNIADANPDLPNLRRLTPGQVLEIPPLTAFSRPLVNGR